MTTFHSPLAKKEWSAFCSGLVTATEEERTRLTPRESNVEKMCKYLFASSLYPYEYSSAALSFRAEIVSLDAFTYTDMIKIEGCIQLLCTKEGEGHSLIVWCRALKETLGDRYFDLMVRPQALSRRDMLGTFIGVIQKLLEMEKYSQDTLQFLQPFADSRCTLSQLSTKLDGKQDVLFRARFPEKNLMVVRSEYEESHPSLTSSQIDSIFSKYEKIKMYGAEICSEGIKGWSSRAEKIRTSSGGIWSSTNDSLMLIAIGREAIRAKYGIYPYNTQILTVLTLLSYDTTLKGRLAQVRTGEGKSTIITLMAFVLACQGKSVDIVSSSRYLSIRDVEKYHSFFSDFAINVTHICDDNPREFHFQGQILYGTNYDFEFAFMRDQVKTTPMRSITKNGKVEPKPYEVVIVDEVDNLFIDSALNSARIGIPALETHKWIYGPILQYAKSNSDSVAVFVQIFNLTQRFDSKEVDALRESLLTSLGAEYHEGIGSVSDKQLAQWLCFSFEALFQKKENHDYVIMQQERPTAFGTEKQKEIVIVDWKNTGRLKEKSRWQGGLHQFIEAKHGLEIKDEGVTAASLCHPIYFGLYNQIFGLTGTMGSSVERQEIEQVYKVDSFDVAPYKESLLKELEPVVFQTKDRQYKTCYEEIALMQSNKRPVLVLVETIKESDEIEEYLRLKGVSCQILTERQAEDEDFLVTRAGEPGNVTVATNTAGRGTDITLHPQSLAAGGLHVILTFFPENNRVKMQGMGRAGRQGQPGSSHLILCSNKSVKELYKERDERVAIASKSRMERIAVEKKHYKYLEIFWKQLQVFYSTPEDLFTLDIVESWLKKVKRQQINVIAIEELVSARVDKNRPGSIDQNFSKKAKEILAHTAQQVFAEQFYTKLLDDSNSVENLLESSSELWEGIFKVAGSWVFLGWRDEPLASESSDSDSDSRYYSMSDESSESEDEDLPPPNCIIS